MPSSSPPLARGRLAPSPTGHLHIGNLTTLLLGWAQIRRLGGHLTLRVEDLDPPRVLPGALEQQLRDLAWLGIDWDVGPGDGSDGSAWQQSRRGHLYQEAFDQLMAQGMLYGCRCSRKDIQEALSAPHGAPLLYPGTCASLGHAADAPEMAARLRVHGVLTWTDGVHGPQSTDLAREVGDVVLRRKDGLWAYQLAVVVDDQDMRITHVLRGDDLLHATPVQHFLHTCLGGTPPQTWHAPLILAPDGKRLTKRDGAQGVQALQEAGWTPDAFRGSIAHLLGFIPAPEPLDAHAFLDVADPDRLHGGLLRLPPGFLEGPPGRRSTRGRATTSRP